MADGKDWIHALEFLSPVVSTVPFGFQSISFVFCLLVLFQPTLFSTLFQRARLPVRFLLSLVGSFIPLKSLLLAFCRTLSYYFL